MVILTALALIMVVCTPNKDEHQAILRDILVSTPIESPGYLRVIVSPLSACDEYSFLIF